MSIGYDMSYIRHHVPMDAWIEWSSFAFNRDFSDEELNRSFNTFREKWGDEVIRHIYIARGDIPSA